MRFGASDREIEAFELGEVLSLDDCMEGDVEW